MKNKLTLLLSSLLLCSCSPKEPPPALRAIDRVQAGTNTVWKTGNEDCVLYVTKRDGNFLQGITIVTKMRGEKTTITAATGTLSPGSAGDPADVSSVRLTVFIPELVSAPTNATVMPSSSLSSGKKEVLQSLMLVLRDPSAVDLARSRKTGFNAPAFAILGIGALALLFTTRWFTVRMLHWPETTRYRITAMLPVLMGSVLIGLLLASEQRRYSLALAALICSAFGALFSLVNIQTPSRYSRILGAVFLLIYAYLLFAFALGMMAGGI